MRSIDPEPVPRPEWMEATAVLGDALRRQGFRARPVAQALGIIAWNGRDMDGAYWERSNCLDGPPGDRVDVLVRGGTLPIPRARHCLPPQAWDAGIVQLRQGEVACRGTILPIGEDLVWTDRWDRASAEDGLFLPDSTTLAIRRALSPHRVEIHLDLGSGGGAVAVAAARRAESTFAVDINPRAAEGCYRTAALSGVGGVMAYTGGLEVAVALGPVDRLSFVFPLLVPWVGLPSAPIHTVSASRGLLAEVVAALPGLLRRGGQAFFYVQDWVGGGSVPDALRRAFGARPWRALYWWDHEGNTPVGRLRAGVLTVEADQPGGWAEAAVDAPDVGCDDWWPYLEAHLPS